MRLKQAVLEFSKELEFAGIGEFRLDTELILGRILSLSRAELITSSEIELNSQQLDQAFECIARRKTGEPLAYILGYRDFWKHRFEVCHGILIPRPETELLVETALNIFPRGVSRLADLGSGSGCVGISLLLEWPAAQLLSLDLSPIAFNMTSLNAEKLGVESRTHVLQRAAENLRQAIETLNWSGLDLVVMNPPYIDPLDPEVDSAVRKFEPGEALFADNRGLAKIQAWSKAAHSCLVQRGYLLCEIGCEQGREVIAWFQSLGFSEVKVMKDLTGRDRLVIGRKD